MLCGLFWASGAHLQQGPITETAMIDLAEVTRGIFVESHKTRPFPFQLGGGWAAEICGWLRVFSFLLRFFTW